MDDYGAYRGLGLSWRPRAGTPLGDFARRWTGLCPESAPWGGTCGDGTPWDATLGPVGESAIRSVCRTGVEAPCLRPLPKPAGQSGWAIDPLVRRRAASIEPVRVGGLRAAIVDGTVVLLPVGPEAALAVFMEAASRPIFSDQPATSRTPPFALRLSRPVDEMTGARLLRRVARLATAQSFGPFLIDEITLVGDPGLGRHPTQAAVFELGEPAGAARGPASFGILGRRHGHNTREALDGSRPY